MLFEKDRRLSVDVEADIHERLLNQAKPNKLTLAKITRRMLMIFLMVDEKPGAELLIRRPGQEDEVVLKSIKTKLV